MPGAETWELRELISHRRFLGKQRVALRNRLRSLINGRLYHCPFVELLGAAGRAWLEAQSFTAAERQILIGTLRLHDELDAEIAVVDETLLEGATRTLESRLLKRALFFLMFASVVFVCELGLRVFFSTRVGPRVMAYGTRFYRAPTMNSFTSSSLGRCPTAFATPT